MAKNDTNTNIGDFMLSLGEPPVVAYVPEDMEDFVAALHSPQEPDIVHSGGLGHPGPLTEWGAAYAPSVPAPDVIDIGPFVAASVNVALDASLTGSHEQDLDSPVPEMNELQGGQSVAIVGDVGAQAGATPNIMYNGNLFVTLALVQLIPGVYDVNPHESESESEDEGDDETMDSSEAGH